MKQFCNAHLLVFPREVMAGQEWWDPLQERKGGPMQVIFNRDSINAKKVTKVSTDAGDYLTKILREGLQ